MTIPGPRRLVEKLKDYAACKDYLPTSGLEQHRRSIIDYYLRRFNVKLNKSNVIVGSGSKELLFMIQLISKKEVILQAPIWVSYAPKAQLAGLKYHYIEYHPDDLCIQGDLRNSVTREDFSLPVYHLTCFNLIKEILKGALLSAPFFIFPSQSYLQLIAYWLLLPFLSSFQRG
ncbi:MAG: aminotransferase class I/II-fold pyridoxal phosphate-dependent enzyme [Chitinophagia bacterium]|nr:aminotransferase class I/II-fold pyridoxal phosphate-dependent enzyme [Chitinophagia bacterium]